MGKKDRERAKSGLVHRSGQLIRIRIRPTPQQQAKVDQFIADFLAYKFPRERG